MIIRAPIINLARCEELAKSIANEKSKEVMQSHIGSIQARVNRFNVNIMEELLRISGNKDRLQTIFTNFLKTTSDNVLPLEEKKHEVREMAQTSVSSSSSALFSGSPGGMPLADPNSSPTLAQQPNHIPSGINQLRQ